jgi:hypothetical protein
MAESKSSRRQFLGVAGVSLVSLATIRLPWLAGGQAAPQVPAQQVSIEKWLLNTGQGKVNAALYDHVAKLVG